MEELLQLDLNEPTSITVTIIDSDDELFSPIEGPAEFNVSNKIIVGSKKVPIVHKEISDKELLKKIRKHQYETKSESDLDTNQKHVSSSSKLGPDGMVSIFYENIDDRLQNDTGNASMTFGDTNNDIQHKIKNTSDVKNDTNCDKSTVQIETNIDVECKNVSNNFNTQKEQKICTRTKTTPRKRRPTIETQIDKNQTANMFIVNSNKNYQETINTGNIHENNGKIKESMVLRTIAENLLCIFPSLHNYVAARNKIPYNEKFAMDAKYQFLKIRKEYFLMSYSDFVSTIVPHKGNPEFLKRFYNFILSLANPNDYVFMAQNINMICLDMFQWTEEMQQHQKLRRKRIYSNITPDSARHCKNVGNQNEILKSRLSTPPKNVDKDLEGKVEKYVRSSLLFSAGPPGREIEIKCLTDNHGQDRPTNIYNSRSSSHISNTISNLPIYHNTVPATNTLRSNVNYQRSAGFPHYGCIQSPLLNNSVTNKMVLKPNHEPPPYTSHQWRSNNPCDYLNAKNSSTTEIPHTTSANVPNVTTSTNESIHRTPEERSSISRDSGFISPMIENVLDELESLISEAQPPATCFSPVISRVVSMNPGVNRLPPRPCVVCNTTTNLSCMGCQHVYYCSEICQAANWPYHRNHCNAVRIGTTI